MSSLFAGERSTTGPSNLLEFKAGKMVREGRQLKPDTRKGQVQVKVCLWIAGCWGVRS